MPVTRSFVKRATYSTFQDATKPLSDLLDEVKAQAAKGEKAGVTEYSRSYAAARDIVAQVVGHVSTKHVELFANLGFSDPNDVSKKRNDVVNSALSSWDAAAAKYAKGKAQEGNALRSAFEARMREFDNVVVSKGLFLPAPDK